MSWIIVDNFVESNEKHLELFGELGKENKFFYVRKEFLDFDELDSSEKAELIEENYDLYKDGLLSLKTDVKNRIENRIYEIGNEILGQAVTYDKNQILEILKQEKNIGYLNNLKIFITNELFKDKEKNTLLSKNNLICKIGLNQSYKYFSSEGLLENEVKSYKWYKLNGCSELGQFIEENSCNYNIIIPNREGIDNYRYYINFFEGDTFTLAVKDIKEDFCDTFERIFNKKYNFEFVS